MQYAKPALTFDEQVTLLAARGLIIEDRAAAAEILSRISYYRLSAYWHPYKRADDSLKPDASFAAVVQLYEFDRHLRLQVMDAIERVEVALRTAITYHLSQAFGPFAHCDPAHFRHTFKQSEWLAKVRQEAENSREIFVAHFRDRYDEFPDLPLWMATEILPFGALSRLYEGMLPDQQRPVAAEYGVHHAVLRSWLRTLNYIRNLCAHHARLWNRELAVGPESPRHDARWLPPMTPTNRRVFIVLLMLRQMMARQHEGQHWQQRVTHLITSANLNSAAQHAMGLPTTWLSHPLWDRVVPENHRGSEPVS